MKSMILKLALAGSLLTGALAPMSANAQSIRDLEKQIERRQDKKNEWRNLAYVGGGAALWGLLKGDKTLMFVGAAGALYSLHRYEQDRKSQSKLNRARASMFSRSSFTRNGRTYTRRTVKKNGKTYYQFVRK